MREKADNIDDQCHAHTSHNVVIKERSRMVVCARKKKTVNTLCVGRNSLHVLHAHNEPKQYAHIT